MPKVSTKEDVCHGHDACDPRPFATWSDHVEIEGLPVTREGDSFEDHGCPIHPSHSAKVTKGHPTLEVEGRPVAYVGASVSCDSEVVATGRATVTVGE